MIRSQCVDAQHCMRRAGIACAEQAARARSSTHLVLVSHERRADVAALRGAGSSPARPCHRREELRDVRRRSLVNR